MFSRHKIYIIIIRQRSFQSCLSISSRGGVTITHYALHLTVQPPLSPPWPCPPHPRHDPPPHQHRTSLYKATLALPPPGHGLHITRHKCNSIEINIYLQGSHFPLKKSHTFSVFLLFFLGQNKNLTSLSLQINYQIKLKIPCK